MHGPYYRDPVLPPSPDPSPLSMSSAALHLPQELAHTWAHWRPTKHQAPLTPPHSTLPQRRAVAPQQHTPTVLPPISYFDRNVSRHSPGTSSSVWSRSCHSPYSATKVTPPPSEDYTQWDKHDASSYRLPAVVAPPAPPRSLEPSPSSSQHELPEDPFASTSYTLDWFGSDSHRSSRFIAEKTCEMICYLWFSTLSSNNASPSKRNRLHSSQHPSFSPNSNSSTALLQFTVSPAFVRFMQKVLETTQVSQSVIVLSLQYIYRLKARNPFTTGQAGSEYRVAIAALMLANKFVDDNTYTNKTWSEVSGIELTEVNRMEREFLLGIDFGLYVDKTTYEGWLNLLKGLVSAKERDAKHWQRSRYPVRTSHLHRPHCHRHAHAHTPQSRAVSHRARSSSPRRSSFCVVSHPSPSPSGYSLPRLQQYTPAPLHHPSPYASPAHSDFPAGSKRSASAAFSPTSASFPAVQQPPAQVPRRTQGLTLDIPQPLAHSRDSSASPLESLTSFSKLSLGASPVDNGPVPVWPAVRHDDYPRTLVSAYRMDDQRQAVAPQHLYFYSLAGSPLESEEERRSRKARLRYHQAPVPTAAAYQYPPSMPMVVQSASTSPYEMHSHVPAPQPVLPPFSEVSQAWAMGADGMSVAENAQLPPIHVEHDSQHQSQAAIPSAPFANAGPPGVQFYSTMTPDLAPHYYRTRGRQA
ncbi:cyclin-domain-containing protein [Trametes elegans]|nr:cyclin-domain-containing protein [Trametes elegans]